MKSKRIHWVDSLRGLVIVMMIIFHFVFDLNFLEIYSVDLYSGFWLIFVRFIQFTFLLLVGFSLYLSYKSKKPYSKYQTFQLKRAIKLFLIALGISFVTLIVVPDAYIHFGVLHLISVGIVFGSLLVRYPRILFGFIFLSLILGALFTSISSSNLFLVPLGIVPDNFYTIDYFPIFPWLALIFSGSLFGHIFDHFQILVNLKKLPRLKMLEMVGQKSLIIYLVHQPVLLGIIWLIF